MKSLSDHLAHYAEYHRDRRNIATHFVGIPMIVLGIAGLLARPAFALGPLTIAPVVPIALLTLAFYFRLDLRFGLAMSACMGAAAWAGMAMGAQSTAVWLWWSAGLFVLGWAIQFIGHVFEGKKPAFVDDLVGLLVGPLFIVAEVSFALHLRTELHEEITRRAGPTHNRRRPLNAPTQYQDPSRGA